MREKEDRPRATGTSLLEWAVAGFGGVLVTAVLVYLGVQALSDHGGPPVIRFAGEVVERSGAAFVVTTTVVNDGPETAAALDLEARLSAEGQLLETATVTLDTLPRRSRRQVGFLFSRDPRGRQVSFRALGYTEP